MQIQGLQLCQLSVSEYGCWPAYGIGIMEIVLTYTNEQMPKMLPSASTYAIAYKYLRGWGAN